jgi:hypothetical protein
MDSKTRSSLVQRIEAQAVETRRRALAASWSFIDAEALLRVAPSLEHVDLCVQSLMLQCCGTHHDDLEEEIAFALGRIASWSSMELLDTVLTQHTPWLRILELAWLCDARDLASLLLQGPLAGHAVAVAVADSSPAPAKSLDT